MHAPAAPAAPVTYLKTAQVAARLRVSVRHVQNLIAKGELTGVRMGDALRVRDDDLTAYEARIHADGKAAAEAASRQ